MEASTFIHIVAWVVVLFAVKAIRDSWLHARKQRLQTQKYPFYRLRDEIVYSLATSETTEVDEKTYRLVNSTIGKLRKFDFKFYSFMTAKFLDALFEEGYKCDFNEDIEKTLSRLRQTNLSKYEREYASLVVGAAKQNSILLRLAMTKVGYRILFNVQIYAAIIRLTRRHSDWASTLREYSVINRNIRSSATS